MRRIIMRCGEMQEQEIMMSKEELDEWYSERTDTVVNWN